MIKRVDQIYDIEALQAQQTAVIEMLAKTKQAIIELNNSRVASKGSDLSSFTQATQALEAALSNSNKAIDKTVKAHQDLTSAQKLAQQQADALAKAQEKGTALLSDNAIEIQKQTILNQQQAKANKEVAMSVLGLVDDYGQLKKQYDAAANSAKNLSAIALRTGDAGDQSAATAATAKAKALHDSLLTIEQGVGQSQRNVGNYTGALKVLNTALTDAKAKLDSMSTAERTNTSEGQKLTKEMELLQTLVGQQDQGFTSLRRELMNSTQALATMYDQGLKNTAAYQELQTVVANTKRELNEFQNQQKLLASESPAIAGLTAVAKGLGSAYAIGAGSVALFGEGNEKLEKELNKLVAVMTLLQGLTELNKTLQERTAIATSLNGVKTGFLNAMLAIKNFILTGSTTATAANTASTLVNAGAQDVLAVSTNVASKAMVGLRFALMATGIGALLLLLPLFVTGMGKIKKETEDASKMQEAYNDALKSAESEFTTAQHTVSELTEKIHLAKTGFMDKKQVLDDYNDTIGKTVGFAKNLDEAEGTLIKNGQAYIDMTLQKAIAQRGYEAAAKASFDIAVKQIDEDKQKVVWAKAAARGVQYAGDLSHSISEDNKKDIKELDDTRETSLKIAENASKKAAEIAKAYKLNIYGDNTQDKDKKAKEDHSIEESQKRIAELNKKSLDERRKQSEAELKILLDQDKSEADNQENSLNKRLDALQEFYDVSLILNEKDKQAKLKINDEEAAIQVTDAEIKLKNHKQQLAKELIAIEEKRIATQSGIIAASNEIIKKDAIIFAEGTLKITKEEYAKEEKAMKEHIKEMKDAHDSAIKDQITTIDNTANKKSLDTENEYAVKIAKAVGKRKVELEDELNKKLKAIDEQRQLDILKLEEADLEHTRDELEALGADTTDIEAKITDNLRNQIKVRGQMQDEAIKKAETDRKRRRDAEVSIATDVVDATQAIFDAGFEKKKNAIQAQMDLSDQQRQKDIDAENASADSVADKAAKISIIEARAATEKEVLARKEKKIEHDKAVFDKEIDILKTIGAIAVDIADGNWIAAAAAGVALIKLIATPIPGYKTGRGATGVSEIARVGEGGVPEYIHRENGLIEQTPSVETLTHLGPRDRVYPNKQQMMRELGMPHLSNYSIGASGIITKNDMQQMTSEIKDAVNGINITTTLITKEGWATQNKRLEDYNSWVSRVIKN